MTALDKIFAERDKQRREWGDDYDDKHDITRWGCVVFANLDNPDRSDEQNTIVLGALMLAIIQMIGRKFQFPDFDVVEAIETAPQTLVTPISYQTISTLVHRHLPLVTDWTQLRPMAFTFLCYAVRLLDQEPRACQLGKPNVHDDTGHGSGEPGLPNSPPAV